MIQALRTNWRLLVKQEQGKFTIEASLLFPLIFLVTITFVFFSLFVYQKVSLYYAATMAAERIAYNWDNSNKHEITGEYKVDAKHGGKEKQLYWRLFDDNFSDTFFTVVDRIAGEDDSAGAAGECQPSGAGTIVPLPGGAGASGSLPDRKINNYASNHLSHIQGYVSYRNLIVDRKVTVCLQTKLKLPSFASALMGNGLVKQTAHARVNEPVEFMRMIDLTTTYTKQLNKHLSKQKKPGKITPGVKLPDISTIIGLIKAFVLR